MLGTGEIGIANAGLIDERLQRHSCGVGREARRTGCANHASAAADSARYFFRKLLPIASELSVFSVVWVSQKATFHQHSWNSCFSENVVTTATNAAIRRGRSSGDVVMNGGGEWQAVMVIEIRLDAICPSACGGVEVNTDKNCVAV